MQPGPDVELRTCLLNLLCDLCIGLTEAFREAVPELSDRDNDSINRRLVLILLRFSTLKIKLEILHLHISHNTPCLSPPPAPPPQKKKLHNLCFFISPGYYNRPKTNSYATSIGANKMYYGRFPNGE